MTNPLLSRVKLPGRVFQLPSKGKFYGDGMFATHVRNGEVEVRPMSGLLELKVKTPDLLYSGRVLPEICAECAPDILRPNDLVTRDVEALFCFLRAVTYGSEMVIPYQHGCKDAKEHNYKVNLDEIIAAPNNEKLDNLMVLNEVEVPNKQKVKICPVRFNDAMKLVHLRAEIDALDLNKEEARAELEKFISELVILELMAMVDAVDEVTDKVQIAEWLRSVPRSFWKVITERGNELSMWGFNLKRNFHCADCKETFEYDLQLDPIRFFSG